jgi:SAM-dependent methyltransferase
MPATREAFFNLARALAKEASIPAEAHAYFEQHRDRLWETICAFKIPGQRFNRVLDIGPYFSYTPFFWKENVANEVSVLEGKAPESAPLEKLYRSRGIEIRYEDLFRLFDEGSNGQKRLPYPDESFDLITCWETMEHFNFNPVPFVRELHRITKKGGTVCVTVPNMAKLDRRLKLLFGRSFATPVESYQQHAGSKYYGFHWREYTLSEITELFQISGFGIALARHLQTFENRPANAVRSVKRALASAVTAVFPSTGALCLVKAAK